jgi:tetratricopeptide (TPR) repeat protein
MQELVQHLCRIIANRLQAKSQMSTADLVTAVLAQIASNDRLQQLLDDSKARIVQNNSGDASGYQVRVEGGVVYVGNEKVFNIAGDNVAGDKVTGDKVNGDKYVYNFNLILKQLGLVPVGIPHNINRYGSEHFVGRGEELQELDRLLQSSRQVAVTAVQGMGGVGKTELALQYALEQLRAEIYPGSVCWLRGREDVGGQIEVFAQTQLGIVVPEELKNRDLSERVAYYWRRWREGEVLVVVDDVLDYDAIAGYLPPVEARFKVLLTTRLELGSGIQRLALGVLAPAAALDLLRRLIGAGRVDGELADAESLCEWLGYLPLGIELVGRYLARNRTLTLAKMQERLNEKRLAARGLIKHDVAMTATHVSLAAAFEVSWEDLGNGAVFAAPVGEYARQLGALLSVFAVAPIPWKWVVDCVREWDEEALEAARDEGLVGSHLLQVNGDNTYQLHPMVREFLAVKCDGMSVKGELQEIFENVIWAVAEKSSKQPEKSLIVECNYVIPHLQESIQQSEDAGRVNDTASGLNNIGSIYYAMGRYIDAEPLFVRALDIREKQLGSDHPSTASTLYNLARLYEQMGKYRQSEPLYVRSLTIREQQLGADHPDTASSLNNLAGLYRQMGRYDEAEPLYLRSLSICERKLGANHRDTASCLNNVANFYRIKGKYSEAEGLYLRSLTIREQQLGADHPDTAQSLNNLAGLYQWMDRDKEAEPLYLRSLDIWERQLGADHIDTATSIHNLAGFYTKMGKYKEAEELYRRSQDISERQLGTDHPGTAQGWNDLAVLYYKMDRYEESEKLHLLALAICERQLGGEHPQTSASLNNLALLYEKIGRYSESEALYLRSFAIREQKLGVDHPFTQATRDNLARLRSKMFSQE